MVASRGRITLPGHHDTHTWKKGSASTHALHGYAIQRDSTQRSPCAPPDSNALSSNSFMPTKAVLSRLPLHPVSVLCVFTHARLQVRQPQPGQRYFDATAPHCSHAGACWRGGVVSSSSALPAHYKHRRDVTGASAACAPLSPRPGPGVFPPTAQLRERIKPFPTRGTPTSASAASSAPLLDSCAASVGLGETQVPPSTPSTACFGYPSRHLTLNTRSFYSCFRS